jgi:hypothetical protein
MRQGMLASKMTSKEQVTISRQVCEKLKAKTGDLIVRPNRRPRVDP